MENKKTKQIIAVAVVVAAIGVLGFLFSRAFRPEPENSGAITGSAAVFLEPGDAWVEEMKKTYGEEAFKTVAEGARASREQAEEFFKSKDLKIVRTKASYVEFKKDTGETVAVDRTAADRLGWTVYIFNGRDNPIDVSTVSMNDLPAEYERYFTGSQGQE